MNELPPRAPRVIRKSAYGRTQLFLPSKDALIREVKCMGGVVRYEQAHVYHVLPDCRHRPNVLCWHCCEPIENPKSCVPIPCFFDSIEVVYHVYGATCSPGCAKAYIIEHTSFGRSQQLNVLSTMLRDVYAISTAVIETPPRPTLVAFGGCFDPKRTMKTECKLVHPPFVSYCMIAEEKAQASSSTLSLRSLHIEEADMLDEPPPPALFTSFVAKKHTENNSAAEAVQTGRVTGGPSKRVRDSRTGANGAGSSSSGTSAVLGPMAKFVKK